MFARFADRTINYAVNPEAVSFSAAAAPLVAAFGDRLTLWRDGNRVQWACDGQSVVVELQADGSLDATFVDCAAVDVVSGHLASAVYRRDSGIAYRMSPDGSKRMVADMAAFFEGTREPLFAFVDAIPVEED